MEEETPDYKNYNGIDLHEEPHDVKPIKQDLKFSHGYKDSQTQASSKISPDDRMDEKFNNTLEYKTPTIIEIPTEKEESTDANKEDIENETLDTTKTDNNIPTNVKENINPETRQYNNISASPCI
ncbi:MAG: hypothetical protein MHPSP_000203 [Paramarteilia canceri]